MGHMIISGEALVLHYFGRQPDTSIKTFSINDSKQSERNHDC